MLGEYLPWHKLGVGGGNSKIDGMEQSIPHIHHVVLAKYRKR